MITFTYKLPEIAECQQIPPNFRTVGGANTRAESQIGTVDRAKRRFSVRSPCIHVFMYIHARAYARQNVGKTRHEMDTKQRIRRDSRLALANEIPLARRARRIKAERASDGSLTRSLPSPSSLAIFRSLFSHGVVTSAHVVSSLSHHHARSLSLSLFSCFAERGLQVSAHRWRVTFVDARVITRASLIDTELIGGPRVSPISLETSPRRDTTDTRTRPRARESFIREPNLQTYDATSLNRRATRSVIKKKNRLLPSGGAPHGTEARLQLVSRDETSSQPGRTVRRSM